jgi:hypothetical protein
LNNKFLLTDKSDGKYYFDVNGFLSERITGYEYKVSYDYFKDGINNFQNAPFQLTPASDSKISLGTLQLPQSLSLQDNVNKKTIVFNYSDTSKQIKYYSNDNAAVFSCISLLQSGHLKAADRNGNAIFFNAAGEFESLIPARNRSDFIKSVEQGDYKAEFVYCLLPENIPVVSKILIYKSLERKRVYTIEYSYDDYGNVVKRAIL